MLVVSGNKSNGCEIMCDAVCCEWVSSAWNLNCVSKYINQRPKWLLTIRTRKFMHTPPSPHLLLHDQSQKVQGLCPLRTAASSRSPYLLRGESSVKLVRMWHSGGVEHLAALWQNAVHLEHPYEVQNSVLILMHPSVVTLHICEL